MQVRDVLVMPASRHVPSLSRSYRVSCLSPSLLLPSPSSLSLSGCLCNPSLGVVIMTEINRTAKMLNSKRGSLHLSLCSFLALPRAPSTCARCKSGPSCQLALAAPTHTRTRTHCTLSGISGSLPVYVLEVSKLCMRATPIDPPSPNPAQQVDCALDLTAANKMAANLLLPATCSIGIGLPSRTAPHPHTATLTFDQPAAAHAFMQIKT